jgi:hypothetical protein
MKRKEINAMKSEGKTVIRMITRKRQIVGGPGY